MPILQLLLSLAHGAQPGLVFFLESVKAIEEISVAEKHDHI